MSSCGSFSTAMSRRPASRSIFSASSRPQQVPSPAPPWASDTRHAVHRRDRVQERRDRVVEVLLEVARGQDVLHQERAAGPQCGDDLAQHDVRLRLVVNGVERGDQVERFLLAELRDVALFEADVLEPWRSASSRAAATASSHRS